MSKRPPSREVFNARLDQQHILEVCINPDNPERFSMLERRFKPGDLLVEGKPEAGRSPGYGVLLYILPALHIDHPTNPNMYAHAMSFRAEIGIVLN